MTIVNLSFMTVSMLLRTIYINSVNLCRPVLWAGVKRANKGTRNSRKSNY